MELKGIVRQVGSMCYVATRETRPSAWVPHVRQVFGPDRVLLCPRGLKIQAGISISASSLATARPSRLTADLRRQPRDASCGRRTPPG